MMTLGMRLLRTSLLSVRPNSSVSSSSTILMTFCAGVSESSTSASRQRSFVRATNDFTTLKLTSASRSAMRISRMASLMSSSVRRPLPRRPLNMPCRRVDRFSSMVDDSSSYASIERNAWNYTPARPAEPQTHKQSERSSEPSAAEASVAEYFFKQETIKYSAFGILYCHRANQRVRTAISSSSESPWKSQDQDSPNNASNRKRM